MVSPRLCPGSTCCNSSTDLDLHSMEMPQRVAYVSIVSSFFSCVASIVIVFTYAKWKDIRTGSRSVITFLAIADFFTAFGYILGSINYIVTLDKEDCMKFTEVCAIQSYITTWSSLSSFFWTVTLGFYLYLTLVHTKIILANRLMPAFHVLNWAFPIVICLPLLCMHQLGYSPFAASTWCFIRENSKKTKIGLILVAGKLWEILAYVLVILLYAIIKIHIRRQTRIGEERNYLSAGLVSAVRKADSKLVFIPIVFVLLRIWGTLQFFYSLGLTKYGHSCNCIEGKDYHGLLFFGVMQAIGDGGQGWGNFFLYVLASGKIRSRLFGWMLNCCTCAYSKATPDHSPTSKDYGKIQSPEVNQLTPCTSSLNNDAEKNSYHSIGHEPTTT